MAEHAEWMNNDKMVKKTRETKKNENNLYEIG